LSRDQPLDALGHVVEGPRQLRELIRPAPLAHRHARGEVAGAQPAHRLGQALDGA
jgi:hypothetical protein